MKYSIVEKQIGIFRQILNDIAEKENNGSGDFLKYAKSYFCFESTFGWNILMNAFYVFEDTELAKEDFDRFGLQGPSRHENIGEKYLRLYGVLNSLYQQYLAVINLMEIFKLPAKKEYSKGLQESDCIVLRNKIAAHSTNYMSNQKVTDKFDVYEISRSDLALGKIILLKNQDIFEAYDLEVAIDSFDRQVQKVLSKLLKKFIKKKFNNQGKHYKEYEKTELLRNGAREYGDQIIEFV